VIITPPHFWQLASDLSHHGEELRHVWKLLEQHGVDIGVVGDMVGSSVGAFVGVVVVMVGLALFLNEGMVLVDIDGLEEAVGDSVGFDDVGATDGWLDGYIDGALVLQVPHNTLQTSFAGGTSSYESVFFSQTLCRFLSPLVDSQSHVWNNGSPFFILKKNLSIGLSSHFVGSIVATNDGDSDWTTEGCEVGDCVGSVDPSEGCEVGDSVGSLERSEGCEVGDSVGSLDNIGHHSPEQFPSQRSLLTLHQSPPLGTPSHPL